ncbi:MAG: NAD(P)-dependent oxidoreductase [Chloroflexota bacterium]|nr:NAD(P)-dependent oxidoreductase [Chloroflexota bacterium]
MADRPAVGFIGVGNMGRHMAGHVLAAGYRLTVHDAREAAAAPLLDKGASWAASPAAVATASDVVLTSLPGPPQFEEVALGETGVLGGLRDGGVLVDLTTNSPTTVRTVAAAARARGVEVLDAPVSGGVFGAESRRLAIMVGGDRATFERCRPILEAFGDHVVYCGTTGAGVATKLVNNMISLSLNMLLGEALTLGVKAGVELTTLVDVIQSSSGATWKLGENYPKYLFKGNFEPGFAIDLAAKDLRLGTNLAKELGLPLEFANLAEQRFIEAQARGWGGKHADIVVRIQEERAGVELRLPPEPS